jgi:hypothetical protein
MVPVIAFMNLKGGVGKTTLAGIQSARSPILRISKSF